MEGNSLRTVFSHGWCDPGTLGTHSDHVEIKDPSKWKINECFLGAAWVFVLNLGKPSNLEGVISGSDLWVDMNNMFLCPGAQLWNPVCSAGSLSSRNLTGQTKITIKLISHDKCSPFAQSSFWWKKVLSRIYLGESLAFYQFPNAPMALSRWRPWFSVVTHLCPSPSALWPYICFMFCLNSSSLPLSWARNMLHARLYSPYWTPWLSVPVWIEASLDCDSWAIGHTWEG